MSKFEKWVHIVAFVCGVLGITLGLIAHRSITWEGISTLWIMNSWLNFDRGFRKGRELNRE